MKKLKSKLWAALLHLLQKNCDHNPNHVAADIHDGDCETRTAWCRKCGAYKTENSLEWREPRPDWETEGA